MKDLTSPTAISFSWIALLLLGACIFIGMPPPARAESGSGAENRPPVLTQVRQTETILFSLEMTCDENGCVKESGSTWLKLSAQANDPDEDDIQYVWTQDALDNSVLVIAQYSDFVPSGETDTAAVCFVAGVSREIEMQVVAVDKNGAQSASRSVTVNAGGGDECKEWNSDKEISERAIADDAEAQYQLGINYLNGGKIIPHQNPKKGLAWIRKAADQNNVDALRTLGILYANGKVVPSDYGRAFKFLTRAAQEGDAKSQRILARMHLEEKFNQVDAVKAEKWMTAAAEAGDLEAQTDLGLALVQGIFSKNIPKGIEFIEKAARAGNSRARLNLGTLYVSDLIPSDKDKALYWLEQIEFGDDEWSDANSIISKIKFGF